MGTYTGMRAIVYIKEQYREAFNNLVESGFDWSESDVDFIRDFGEVERADAVVNNNVDCMLDEWSKEEYDEFGIGQPLDEYKTDFEPETGRFSFQCSLKNYKRTIERFLEMVLNRTVSDVEKMEKYCEMNEFYEIYDLEDGKIQVVEKVRFGNVYGHTYGWGYGMREEDEDEDENI